VGLLLLSSIGPTSSADGKPADPPPTRLSGTLVVYGAGEVEAAFRHWATRLQARHPDVVIEVPGLPSGVGEWRGYDFLSKSPGSIYVGPERRGPQPEAVVPLAVNVLVPWVSSRNAALSIDAELLRLCFDGSPESHPRWVGLPGLPGEGVPVVPSISGPKETLCLHWVLCSGGACVRLRKLTEVALDGEPRIDAVGVSAPGFAPRGARELPVGTGGEASTFRVDRVAEWPLSGRVIAAAARRTELTTGIARALLDVALSEEGQRIPRGTCVVPLSKAAARQASGSLR
jgi:hypothetical protein